MALIVLVGLLNFHIPHFLIETAKPSAVGSGLLETVFLLNLVGSLAAAAGISMDARWGWLFGIGIATLSFVLYLAQETVGLPGLPQMWLEPSRIVALTLEAVFMIVALRHLAAVR
jgi:hypothetical protein